MKRSRSVLSVAGTGDERPGETLEPSHSNILGANLRRPRRRLSTGPGLGWADPEPSEPGDPVPPRPTTLPLLIPPRISITRANSAPLQPLETPSYILLLPESAKVATRVFSSPAPKGALTFRELGQAREQASN
uniref:Uncharacterized protein n=1 Tax=Molossus molossus TaxID=27622 RepID=A0A7J8I2R3_MOLMO|nr:hypothetical protein HJG59_000129 [Molossus molossus]